MFILSQDLVFPPVDCADEDGLLCIGGDLSPERLMLAYRSGIFPWYNEDEPILWYSPDPRFVLFPEDLKVSKSMAQLLRKNEFHFTVNKDFEATIRHCRTQKRKEQSGTWIHDEMEAAYIRLHQAGHAFSAECWQGEKLVGGLYGVLLNYIFCGESMFSLEKNASKFAFIHFVRQLQLRGIRLIDCQVYTRHLESLGAGMMAREEFITYL
ncbi:leucyl/phenylalanyl-tRNA--protein transferase [Filimonas sp.]|nr:leucyl/phenylalanyl-tRNA--protein transferase [Filimonas sp.]